MTWVGENLALIAALAAAHLRQTLVALLLALALSVPLGWVAWRYRLARGGVLAVTGLLYTIPSIALLILLPTALGFSFVDEFNLTLALTLYAVAILVRSVAEGLDGVGDAVRQASTALGYGPVRRFLAVELPLAGPVILAGLRVTAASTLSLATVGILVGISNLGYLFVNGLQRRIIPEVFAGVVAVVVLAVAIDALLVLAGRLVLPWTTVTGRQRAGRASPAPGKVRA